MKHLIIHINDTSIGFSLVDENLTPLQTEKTFSVNDNFQFAPIFINDYLIFSVCNNQSKKGTLDYKDIEIDILGKKYKLTEVEETELYPNG